MELVTIYQLVASSLTRSKIFNFTRVFCLFFLSLKKSSFMNTKLTLVLEQEIIQKAKDYAKQKNRSLSNIIENYGYV